MKVIFASLTGDILLDALVGALFAMISYSSLAAVLLTATLAGAAVISLPVAIGLVIGYRYRWGPAPVKAPISRRPAYRPRYFGPRAPGR